MTSKKGITLVNKVVAMLYTLASISAYIVERAKPIFDKECLLSMKEKRKRDKTKDKCLDVIKVTEVTIFDSQFCFFP